MPKRVNHGLRREDIAKAAFRVIQRKGVANATIRDIAAEAGSSPGAVLHYITSKDHIFLQAAEYSTLVIRGRMEAVERDYHGLEALRRIVDEALPVTAEMLGHWKIWLGFWNLSGDSELIRAAIHDRYDESFRRFGRLLRAAQALGEISPSLNIADAAAALVCQIDGIGVNVLISGRPLSSKKIRRQIDQWIESVLVKGTAKPEPANLIVFPIPPSGARQSF
ncbi:MAG TPA: TetR/AcrR family transcriptional regulator [Rhizomicrobium sp.]|jgi:AcrR family transcriptional regulator|nr:TetR/AcrR family transcriptional regulator [Rhizomicrobium sp.]